jgi:hypothetical protein
MPAGAVALAEGTGFRLGWRHALEINRMLVAEHRRTEIAPSLFDRTRPAPWHGM